MQRRTVAGVTGDVNASTRMLEEDARRLEHVLNNCFQDVVSALTDAEAGGFTNFRGDSWQFVVGNPGMGVAGPGEILKHQMAWFAAELGGTVKNGLPKGGKTIGALRSFTYALVVAFITKWLMGHIR